MTRKERICALNISEKEKRDFFNIYSEYEKNSEKRDSDSLCWRLKELLPKSQQLLEERYKPRREVKCLFILVGTTIEPLLLSILTIRPTEKLVLICSSESKMHKNQLIATLRQIYGSFDIIPKSLLSNVTRNYIENIKSIHIDDNIVIENITPNKVFSSIKNRIGGYHNDDVGVDITGGKKSMVGGGFLVAAINNYHLFYIDFDEYIDDHPKPGTEYIHILENPYDIYNIHEEAVIQSFWERQDFNAVIKVANKTIEKLTVSKAKQYDLEKERNRLVQIKIAACCYSDWSRYNYLEALNSVFSFNYYAYKQEGILSVLADCENMRKDAYGAILLSLDRWTRGVDALRLDELDKSALCFTQAIEVLCEYRLYDMTEKGYVCPQFKIGEIHFDVSSIIKFLWDSKNQKMLINKLELKQDVMYFWNQVVRFEKKTKPSSANLIEKLSIRNKLAHFNCFDKKNNAENKSKIEDFKDTVRQLIVFFLEIYQNEDKLRGKIFDALQSPFNFAKFSDFE